ncbi:hypothetical protein LR69_03850 [Geobacillus sp. BCO2]|nr:hypothetical protein LR69_03850 [Geobacillus sp. BCO2]
MVKINILIIGIIALSWMASVSFWNASPTWK